MTTLKRAISECNRRGAKYAGEGAQVGAVAGTMSGGVKGGAAGAGIGSLGGYLYGCLSSGDVQDFAKKTARTIRRVARRIFGKKRKKTLPSPSPEEALAIIAYSWSLFPTLGPSIYEMEGKKRVKRRFDWVLSRSTLQALYGEPAADWNAKELAGLMWEMWRKGTEHSDNWSPEGLVLHVIARVGDFLSDSKPGDTIEDWPLFRPRLLDPELDFPSLPEPGSVDPTGEDRNTRGAVALAVVGAVATFFSLR